MNSPFANIFLALSQHIHDTVPAIFYIDQDLGQLSKDASPPVAFPCVLIDFDSFTYDNLSDNVQTANGFVLVTLGFKTTAASSQSTPVNYVQEAVAYYDLEWQLNQALQGWSPGDDYGSLNRKGVTTLKIPGIRVRQLKYQLSYQDYSTKRSLQYVPAQIVVVEE